MSCSRFYLVALVLLALLASACPTHGAARRKRQRREITPLTGPTDEQVWDSGLLEKQLSYATLLERGRQYYEETSVKRFKGFVLGYVTPWNRLGYENAVRFRHKLGGVAPVWYVARKAEGQAVELTGGHEANDGWIGQLKEGGGGPLVLPRVLLEMAPQQHVENLQQGAQQLLAALAKEFDVHQYDGIVLECWMQWHLINGLQNDAFRALAFKYIRDVADWLHARKAKLVLAIPPLVPPNEKAPWASRDDVVALSQWVDYWSVMTYDYSTNRGVSGPNSPLTWLKSNTKVLKEGSGEPDPMPLPQGLPAKTLMGANFYGWDFSGRGPEAVTCEGLLPLLQRHQPDMQWDDKAEEHAFKYTDAQGGNHVVWYPTPRALQLRVEALEQEGVGLSIWELGQGCERFFDLL